MFQILVSTMNDSTLNLVRKLNAKTPVLISNQGESSQRIYNIIDGHNHINISKKEYGLSRSRNTLLDNATGTYCFIADDDLVYTDDYVDNLKEAINLYPDADILIFNIEDGGNRYRIKNDFKVTNYSFQRFGSVRIVFKLKSIKENNIRFHELFGAGSYYSSGEDTIFLKQCLDIGLNIQAINRTIAVLTNERESTWFVGFNLKYFFDKGAIFREMYPFSYPLWILQFAARKYKSAEDLSFISVINSMFKGAIAFRRGEYLAESGIIKSIM